MHADRLLRDARVVLEGGLARRVDVDVDGRMAGELGGASCRLASRTALRRASLDRQPALPQAGHPIN